ncbi:MAG: Crp/Fnr family transcriptional regulator [Thermonemataceae bacterium]
MFNLKEQLTELYPVLASIAQPKSIVKRQCLLQPGQHISTLYFVQKGALKQYYVKEGKEVVFRLITSQAFCTSAYALITHQPTSDFIEAVEDTDLLAIDYPKLCQLYKKDIRLANLGREITEHYFILEQERVMSLNFKKPIERYQALLEKHPNYFETFNLGTIASYLGMTQETLSRVRGKRF